MFTKMHLKKRKIFCQLQRELKTSRDSQHTLCILSSTGCFFLSRFRATLYQCPETVTERREMTDAIRERIADLESVLQTTQDHRITQLQGIAQDIDIWQQKVSIVMMM